MLGLLITLVVIAIVGVVLWIVIPSNINNRERLVGKILNAEPDGNRTVNQVPNTSLEVEVEGRQPIMSTVENIDNSISKNLAQFNSYLSIARRVEAWGGAVLWLSLIGGVLQLLFFIGNLLYGVSEQIGDNLMVFLFISGIISIINGFFWNALLTWAGAMLRTNAQIADVALHRKPADQGESV